MRICDLHTHILPGVDDGAQSPQMALEMLRNAVASDVQMLVMTPHCNVPGTSGNYCTPQLEERFLRLQEAARDIPVDLALGAEAHVTRELPDLLRKGRICSINNSRYLLTEFPFWFAPEDFPQVLADIQDCGYVPLVAHPERYDAVRMQPQIVEKWLDMGCHIQITGGSIVGEYGRSVRDTAAFLLKNDFVCCVASDAHGTQRRSNFLLDVCDHLSLYYSKQYAQVLMDTNPVRIWRDESL